MDVLEELELSSEQVFDGGLLSVWRDSVRLPDGTEGRREYIRHPGAVVVVALLADGRIVFERQFRYPLRRAFIELPAGKIDRGEDILDCARRELLEEAGPLSQNCCRLVRITNPGAIVEERSGEIRTSLQGQSSSAVVAA